MVYTGIEFAKTGISHSGWTPKSGPAEDFIHSAFANRRWGGPRAMSWLEGSTIVEFCDRRPLSRTIKRPTIVPRIIGKHWAEAVVYLLSLTLGRGLDA